MIDFSRNYFELFGLSPMFRIDAAALDGAYLRLQSEVHPDRFAGAPDAQKRVALQSSARVNEAYRTLKDPVQRARYLLSLRGVDALAETDTRLPFDFLERQLTRREAAGDAATARDAPTIAALLTDVRAEVVLREGELAAAFDLGAATESARMQLRELTFLAKFAEDLDGMLAEQDA